MAKKMVTSVDELFYGLEDEETIQRLEGVQELSIIVNETQATADADGGVYAIEESVGDIAVSLTLATLELEDYVKIYGKKKDADGGIIDNVNDVKPFLSLYAMKRLQGGVKEYITLFKGKMQLPEEKVKTAGKSIELQSKSLNGTFMANSDGNYRKIVRTDDPDFNKTTWEAKWGKKHILANPKVEEEMVLKVGDNTIVRNETIVGSKTK